MFKLICLLVSLAVFCSAEEASEGEFNGNLFEGDIILPPSLSRAGRRTNRWPGGVFYYKLTSGISSQSRAMSAIRGAIAEWERKTCIRFKVRTNERAYVEFVTGRGGCWSNGIGRNGNQMQTINLDSGCWGVGTVVHEIGHALGFWHEQSRPDRDEYITILWDNIKQGMQSQFKKVSQSDVDSKGSPYDYASVMHYPKWAFQKARGLDTIRPKKAGVSIGQRNELSGEDAKQMQMMYKRECGGGPGPTNRPVTQRPTSGGSCVDKNRSCPTYKSRGYCASSHRFYRYMKDNCAKSCGLCQGGGGGGGGGSCPDKDKRCPSWRNYCTSNDYVRTNCKKTCGTC